MSRALQINSSPQGWMARNTKPVPLAEKGWAITMKKISIILLSAVLVFSMAACNGGKEKADNQTEKQMESVKPTEEVAMATEAVTEVTTEAGSEETEKDIAEVKDSEEKTDKEDNQSADNETASKQKEKSEQDDEPEQAHETTYGEFKTVRDDLHRLWRVKSCVDTAARFNEHTEEQKLQNRPQTRHKKEDMTR